MTKKKNRKIVEAIFEVEGALNDAIANKDETVVLDVKTVKLLVGYAVTSQLKGK